MTSEALQKLVARARVAGKDGGNVFKSSSGQNNGAAPIGSNQGTRIATAASASSSSANRGSLMVGKSLHPPQSGPKTISDGGDDDDDGDDGDSYGSSDPGTGSGSDSGAESLKGAAHEARRREWIHQNNLELDKIGVAGAYEKLRKPKRKRRQREKGARPSRRSERSTAAGAGPTAGGGSGEGAGDGDSAKKRRRSVVPMRFTELREKFGYTHFGAAADGDCLFSSTMGCIGVIRSEQATNPDDVTTEYKRRLRSVGCEMADELVETCADGMPLWTYQMLDGKNASNQDAYRKTLKQELAKLKEPYAFNFNALEYVIWALALLIKREIVVLNLLDDGMLCGHFRLYGCRNGKSHSYRLDELQQVLEISTLVLVRQGPAHSVGHFTYLRTSGGHGMEDLSSSERVAFLMRIGALAPVPRASGSALGSGGSKRVSIPLELDNDEALEAPVLKALNTVRTVQQPAVEPSPAAVEAELRAEIAQLRRELEKKSTELRRVDHELNQAAAGSDIRIGGCAPPPRSVRNDPAGS